VRKSFLVVIVVVFVLQILLFMVVWGSPQQRLERSLTPTPSSTPIPPPPTAVGPTPIATLIPVEMGAPTRDVNPVVNASKGCQLAALDLIGAWVKAGKPETAPFELSGADGKVCLGTFAKDVQPLFTTPNLWFNGALACVTCHSADLDNAAANMSLGSYAGILAGSRRSDAASPGENILGDEGAWEKAKIYFMITTRQMPQGRPADSPEKGPVISAGTLK
jgi:hypothetical protein